MVVVKLIMFYNYIENKSNEMITILLNIENLINKFYYYEITYHIYIYIIFYNNTYLINKIA